MAPKARLQALGHPLGIRRALDPGPAFCEATNRQVTETKRVVVTGPESTGKTTLAKRLAERFGARWVPEYVRAYLESLPPRDPLSLVFYEDVEPIARGQIAAEDDAAAAGGLIICDTDLHSTRVYSDHYFGRSPEWVKAAARSRPYDLHLLLDVDLPWTPDPMRDRPFDREEMLRAFEAELQAANRRVIRIRGLGDARFTEGEAAVAALLV